MDKASMTDPRDPPEITADLAKNIPTWRAAYSDRTCALMAAFCQLAYISFDPLPPSDTKGVPAANAATNRALLESKLAAGGFRLVEIFNHKFTQAFLAVNPDEFAVLAFRGTADFPNWETNLHGLPVALPGRDDVQVHSGFLCALDGCRQAIVDAINNPALVPPDLGLYITGHSLGGALAQLASAAIENDNVAACYTFGSPRVGTSNFDRLVKCPHYRLVNNWDIVPGVPPPWFAGYRHTGDPRLLKPGKPDEALRRDRFFLAELFIDVLDLIKGVATHSFNTINEHMIWNYRTQLEAIAAARATPAPKAAPPAPPPAAAAAAAPDPPG